MCVWFMYCLYDCCKVGHFNMGVYGIDSLLQPVSRGQSINFTAEQNVFTAWYKKWFWSK